MQISEITPYAAEDVIEQLRFGNPPLGASKEFTVGREDQIRELESVLELSEEKRSLLIHANYGAGKTHLLRVIREIALERGFVVALIVADAEGGIRFNRMDTIFGAVCREMEIPDNSGKSVGVLFEAYRQADETEISPAAVSYREKISNGDKWNFSDRLIAPGIYVALRAWVHSSENPAVRDRIKAWLSNPENYRSQRKLLYSELVASLRTHFLDPRPDWKFYADEIFLFHTGGHRQSWDALVDFHQLAVCSGYRGLILLVDEFEDVIQNLNRRNFQQEAFYNLFRFFAGERFPGHAFFAVTPDFTQKCKRELLRRSVYEFDYGLFDRLPYFRLSPLKFNDAFRLAKRIRNVHAIAYGWRAEDAIGDAKLRLHCERKMREERPDKIRHVITSIVNLLDSRLD